MSRTIDPAHHAVLTTNVSKPAVVAIRTQPDDDGRNARWRTKAASGPPRSVTTTTELLAVVHTMLVFRQRLLGSVVPRPAG